MSFASSSSTCSLTGAARAAFRPRPRSLRTMAIPGMTERQGRSVESRRTFAAPAPRVESTDHHESVMDAGPSSFRPNSTSSPSSSSHPSRSSPSVSPLSPEVELTPSRAQSYLSDLLHLPPDHAFSPSTSIQLLTHKSYRYAHLIRHPKRDIHNHSEIDPEARPSSVSHNSRFSFLGRRAIQAYLAIFIHSHLHTSSNLGSVDFLRGKRLEEKLEAMRHASNLGREVGTRWGLSEVMRWDRNETSTSGGAVRIQGQTVESIIGGVFSTHGSPAAQRAFHLHVLPYLAPQLRDPLLIERAESAREQVYTEGKGSIILP